MQRHIGLRCEAMVILGLIWILMGIGVEVGASQPSPGLAFTVLPVSVRAIVWAATGLLAIVTGWRSDRTPVALAGLIVMPLIRLTSYVWAWLLWLWPGSEAGEYEHGWYHAGFYLAMVVGIWIVAHIPPGLLRTIPSPDRERQQ